MKEIIKDFLENKDDKYADFNLKLMPGMAREKVIGVRTPILRKLAKKYKNHPDVESFLNELPHSYFEENQLHGFIISEYTDFDRCIQEVDKFLPHIDNWATCDQTSPKVFKKNTDKLKKHIYRWLESDKTYTIRFAIGMLMQHYLDEYFDEVYLEKVSGIVSDEYYVNMEIAWYMATALAKKWDATIVYLEEKKMGKWVHNKTIQKAIESYRITDDQKQYLRTLKIK